MAEATLKMAASMFAYYAESGLPGNPQMLRFLLERPPTSLDSFIERIVNA